MVRWRTRFPSADALDEVEIAVPPGDFLADEHSYVVYGTAVNIKPSRHVLRKCFHYNVGE